MEDTTLDTNNASETDNTNTSDVQDAPVETALAAPAPVAAPRIPMQRVNRRVYVDHKRFGTCITIGATVYLCPLGVAFPAKSAPKCDFIVMDGRVFDTDGGEWVSAGENPGCGPRCPVSLRDTYGKTWINLTHAERKEILKALAAPPAAK